MMEVPLLLLKNAGSNFPASAKFVNRKKYFIGISNLSLGFEFGLLDLDVVHLMSP